MEGLLAYVLSKKYADESMAGAGAVKGAPCTIQSIVDNLDGTHTVTFAWEDTTGTTHTDTMTVSDGAKGAKGDVGATGATGAAGAKGDKGDTGTAATVAVGTVTSGASPSVINGGTESAAVLNFVLPKGDKGDKGDKGNDGADGKSFDIKAQYPTEAALKAAHPTGEAGDAYFVGTDENPDLYIWLSDSAEWFNNGKIAGVKGDKGDTGDDGFSPIASVSKIDDTATIIIRDKTGQTTATVSDGAKGNDGADGFSPSANVTMSGEVLTVRITDKDGTTTESIDLSTKANVSDLGTAAAKNSTTYVSPGNPNLPVSSSVYAAISAATYGVYHPSGSKTIAELNSTLLVQENVGNVYKITEDGVTTSDFIGGAGQTIHTGDNAVVVYGGNDDFKFDLQSGTVDLSGYQTKDLETPLTIGGVSQTTVEGALGGLNSNKAENTDIQNVYSVMGKNGSKNLCSYPFTMTTLEQNGITFTDNGDGTVTANGTATGTAYFNFHSRTKGSKNELVVKNGEYILTCCPANGSIDTYFVRSGRTVNDAHSLLGEDYGKGTNITLNGDDYSADEVVLQIQIIVKTGTVCNNLVFKPMVRLASDPDSTYVPYVPTNAKLNEEKMSYVDNGVLGAKNLIGNPEFPQSGSYYTVQNDNSVVFNGTPSSNLFFNYGFNKNNRNYSYIIPIEPGKSYIVNGCPEGGNGSGQGMPTNYAIRCYAQFSDESLQWIGADYGEGVKITVPSNAVYIFVQIAITSGTVLSNVIFRPMIRLASDPDDTYQPYAMTNRELTNRVIQSVESITLDNTTTDAGNIKLYRYGNLRVLTGHFRPTVAGTSGENAHIADLPSSADYPQFDVPALCGRGAGSSTAESKTGNILVLASGSLAFQGKDLGENMFFNITWIVA